MAAMRKSILSVAVALTMILPVAGCVETRAAVWRVPCKLCHAQAGGGRPWVHGDSGL